MIPDAYPPSAPPILYNILVKEPPRGGPEGSLTSAPRLPLDAARLAAQAAQRAERATALVRAGAVEALGDGRYRVRGTRGGWWAVREAYCNCPDFAWRGHVPCKHLLAVALVRARQAPAA